MAGLTKRLALAATLTVGSVVSSLFCANGIAHAVCGSDRPCFTDVHMEGRTTLVATWAEPEDTDYPLKNFRYSSAGGPEPQSETFALSFTIYGVQPGVTYTLKVQGCRPALFGYDCTPWDTTQFTVPAPAPPPPAPPPPVPVQLPYSDGAVNPHDCPACRAAGN